MHGYYLLHLILESGGGWRLIANNVGKVSGCVGESANDACTASLPTPDQR